MKIKIVVLSAIISVVTGTVTMFDDWVKKYSIDVSSQFKYETIFNNWMINDKIITDTNSKNLSYKLSHNSFSGYSQEEFSNMMRLLFLKEETPRYEPRYEYEIDTHIELPTSIDWRTKGVVNQIKDQGQCGSCWAFSAIQAVESAVALKTGALYNLSEQQVVDCDDMDFGCSGGWMDNAFSWINQNNGVCSDKDYPYVSGNSGMSDKCVTSCSNVLNTKVLSHVDIPINSDTAMMQVLTQQPVSVALEADQSGFQFYSSGVFTGECGTLLDHGVGLVGYGIEGNLGYYIVRNSWGTDWGDNGYMYLGRGNDPVTNQPYNSGKGQCGVLSKASYPIV